MRALVRHGRRCAAEPARGGDTSAGWYGGNSLAWLVSSVRRPARRLAGRRMKGRGLEQRQSQAGRASEASVRRFSARFFSPPSLACAPPSSTAAAAGSRAPQHCVQGGERHR
jgi:hypothetical protein